jgi:hypothetical protein
MTAVLVVRLMPLPVTEPVSGTVNTPPPLTTFTKPPVALAVRLVAPMLDSQISPLLDWAFRFAVTVATAEPLYPMVVVVPALPMLTVAAVRVPAVWVNAPVASSARVPVPALRLLPSAMGLVDCSVSLAFCVVMSPFSR